MVMLLRKRPVIVISVGIACIAVLAGYLYWNRPDAFDPTLQRAFSNAANTRTYEASVETEDVLPDRTLHIEGTYLLDTRNNRYASFSTTTLIAASGGKPIVFSLDNISIGQDLYTKVYAAGKVTLAVPSNKNWLHFQANDIPSAYTGIAVSGPLLDNLKLFGNAGAYVTHIGVPVEQQLDGATLTHYSFKLSSAAAPSLGGTLGALFDRIGKNGLIDAWIDSSGEIRLLRFQNASYVSTTTISAVNEPLAIEPPASSE